MLSAVLRALRVLRVSPQFTYYGAPVRLARQAGNAGL